MNMVTTLVKNSIQNVHAPLPLTAHIIFCVFATLLFLIQYKRKKMKYYLYLIIAFDLMLATHFFSSDFSIIVIFIGEVVLLTMAFLSARYQKKMNKRVEEHKKQFDESNTGSTERKEEPNWYEKRYGKR